MNSKIFGKNLFEASSNFVNRHAAEELDEIEPDEFIEKFLEEMRFEAIQPDQHSNVILEKLFRGDEIYNADIRHPENAFWFDGPEKLQRVHLGYLFMCYIFEFHGKVYLRTWDEGIGADTLELPNITWEDMTSTEGWVPIKDMVGPDKDYGADGIQPADFNSLAKELNLID